jgi:hypothetical protein
MTKVIYAPNDENEVFCDIGEGTYFDYKGSLYLLVDEQRGLVFDFADETSFIWYDEFDAETVIKTISSDRITIKVD